MIDTVAPERIALMNVERELSFRRLERYKPYPKQAIFHRLGGDPSIKERLLMAGNQLGKTLGASMETAMHLTGKYPSWWEGKRFPRQTAGWAASNTGQGTRDNVQRLLLGDIGDWGTGAIPAKDILDIKRNPHGVADAVEIILVKHITGAQSRLTIKSYDQGRKRWQGETLDFIWYDEEPEEEIYSEGKTRTQARGGTVYMTFTPLMGVSNVVRRFLYEKPAGTVVVNMTIEDAPHYTPEERALIIAGYPAHEREARANGIPVLGSGRVFPIAEDLLREMPVSLPPHWPRLVGMDIGYDHPTAAVWCAWDRDTDTIHVYDTYRVKEQTPVVHAAAIKSKGIWIPVAWPHDALQHDKGSSCEQIAAQYKQLGVNMLPVRATLQARPGHPDGSGGSGLEAGLLLMHDRMLTGRFKVAKHLNDWWEEFRLYHRKDGVVVSIGDDLMSASRMATMMIRKAKVYGEQAKPTMAPWAPLSPSSGVGCLGG